MLRFVLPMSLALPLLIGIGLVAPAQSRTFRFANQQDVASLDPYAVDETFTTSFLANIYEPLVRRGRTLGIEPALAASWDQPEPTRWVFHLRPNVRFHDGVSFTASDAVFSLERLRRPTSNMANRIAGVTTVTALDPLTLEIRTESPDPTLLASLTAVLIMPRAWSEAHGAAEPVDLRAKEENYAARHAVGTGPFRLSSRQPGGDTRLAANPDWWDKPEHNLDDVVFTPIGTAATRIAALLSGGTDMIDPVPIQDQARFAGNPDVVLLKAPELRSVFLGMDQYRDELLHSSARGGNPFRDIRVRRAFYAAIDVYALRDRIMQGQSQPSALLSGPGIVGFDAGLNERPRANVQEARQLMREAGYADGFSLEMNCPAGRYVNDEAICQAVAAMLARVNVQVTVTTQAPAAYFGRLAKRDTSFYLLGTTPPTYDSFSTVFSLLMCRPDVMQGRTPAFPAQGASNHGGFCDAQVDSLAADARQQLDPGKRQQDFEGIWRAMIAGVGYIPLHQQALSWGVRRGIEVVQRPDNVLDLRFVRMP